METSAPSWQLFLLNMAVISGVLGQCGKNGPQVLAASYEAQKFQSPNYPASYPSNSLCQWLIVAPEEGATVRVFTGFLELEVAENCLYDFITAYDGNSSRTSSGYLYRLCVGMYTITSTGRYMLIIFKSDDNVEKRGFQISYLAIPMATTSPRTSTQPAITAEVKKESGSGLNTGALIGGVVGGVVFVVVVGILCGRCLGKVGPHQPPVHRPAAFYNSHAPPSYEGGVTDGPPPMMAASVHMMQSSNSVFMVSHAMGGRISPRSLTSQFGGLGAHFNLTNPAFEDDDFSAFPGAHVHPFSSSYSRLIPPTSSSASLPPPPTYCDSMLITYPPAAPPSTRQASASPVFTFPEAPSPFLITAQESGSTPGAGQSAVGSGSSVLFVTTSSQQLLSSPFVNAQPSSSTQFHSQSPKMEEVAPDPISQPASPAWRSSARPSASRLSARCSLVRSATSASSTHGLPFHSFRRTLTVKDLPYRRQSRRYESVSSPIENTLLTSLSSDTESSVNKVFGSLTGDEETENNGQARKAAAAVGDTSCIDIADFAADNSIDYIHSPLTVPEAARGKQSVSASELEEETPKLEGNARPAEGCIKIPNRRIIGIEDTSKLSNAQEVVDLMTKDYDDNVIKTFSSTSTAAGSLANTRLGQTGLDAGGTSQDDAMDMMPSTSQPDLAPGPEERAPGRARSHKTAWRSDSGSSLPPPPAWHSCQDSVDSADFPQPPSPIHCHGRKGPLPLMHSP